MYKKIFLFFWVWRTWKSNFSICFFRSFLPSNSTVITSNINQIAKLIDFDENLKFIEIKNKFLKLFCQKF